MERLTGRKENGWAYIIGCPDFEIPKIVGLIIQGVVDKCAAIEDILGDDYDLDRLRELVEADRDGRFILNPLKADDKVYIVLLGNVFPFEVTSAVWHSGSPVYKAMHGLHLSFVFNQDDIGKTVFLTRKAAEATLKGESR